MAGKSQPILPRILSKIVKDEKTGCWNFTGATIISRGPKGKPGYRYGVIGISQGNKHMLVHRYMYWHTYLEPQGLELDKSLCVCHTCDNTICCNPSHLFLGTNQDNSLDASRKGRLSRGEGHAGNKLTEEQVLEIFTASGTLEAIGKKYGIEGRHVMAIKNQEIWKWLTTGLTPAKENHSKALTDFQVLEIFNSEEPPRVLIEKFGISSSEIHCIKTKKTWKELTKDLIAPTKIHNKKLTDAQVAEIFLMKGSQKSIGEKYNISQSAVHKIKHKLSGIHVTGGLSND